jgi:asparagine synthase (glutamine-hydrolysing)
VPSLALAATPGRQGADALSETMLAAMKDRAPAWAVSAGTILAVGAAAADPQSAAKMISALPTTAIRLAADVPEWERPLLDPVLTAPDGHAGTPDPGAVADLLSSLRGDAHVVAAIGTRACVAYRGAMSGRPLFYAAGADGSLLVATQIRGILAARPGTVSSHGLAAFLVPQLCCHQGTP